MGGALPSAVNFAIAAPLEVYGSLSQGNRIMANYWLATLRINAADCGGPFPGDKDAPVRPQLPCHMANTCSNRARAYRTGTPWTGLL